MGNKEKEYVLRPEPDSILGNDPILGQYRDLVGEILEEVSDYFCCAWPGESTRIEVARLIDAYIKEDLKGNYQSHPRPEQLLRNEIEANRNLPLSEALRAPRFAVDQ